MSRSVRISVFLGKKPVNAQCGHINAVCVFLSAPCVYMSAHCVHRIYPDIDKFLYALRHTFCAHFGKFLQAS